MLHRHAHCVEKYQNNHRPVKPEKTWSIEGYLQIFVPRERYSPLLLDGPSNDKPDLFLVNPKIGIFLELSGKRSLGSRSLGVLVLVVLQQLCKLEMFRSLSIS